MQGEGGIGAIFPAMANAVMALKILGYPDDHPDVVRGIKALDELLHIQGADVLCQPCHSPIWDSCLSLRPCSRRSFRRTMRPSGPVSIGSSHNRFSIPGDWTYRAPDLEPGGWAFQFENALYPDVDDTPMVLMAILRANLPDREAHKASIAKAVNWVLGMQSSDGGWGSFDVDNNYLYLNEIPFADHGALLDPSTSDVTARCIELLSMLGYDRDFPPVAKALKFLRKEQEACGAWFGRWGVNYIYGTWSVLVALQATRGRT